MSVQVRRHKSGACTKKSQLRPLTLYRTLSEKLNLFQLNNKDNGIFLRGTVRKKRW